MPMIPDLHDVYGRTVPLARVSLSTSASSDGLGFLKSTKLKKFWSKYRKPIVGGALAAGAIVGAAYTGGATLTALPAILGKMTKGAGKVVDAVGGPETILSMASGSGGEPVTVAAAPVAALSAMPVRTEASQDQHSTQTTGGFPTPLLIGSGVALLAVLLLTQQRTTVPSTTKVRRP